MGRLLLLLLAIGIAYWIAYVTIWSAIGGVAYGLYRWLGP